MERTRRGSRNIGGGRGGRVADGQPDIHRLLAPPFSVGNDDAGAVRQGANRDRGEPVYLLAVAGVGLM